MHRWLLATVATLSLTVLSLTASGAFAAELPKAMQKALADGHIDAKLLDGLDKELDVPKAWLDGAAKEKEVIVYGTWDDREFRAMTAPFRERYPFVNVKYSRGGTSQRTMQVLVALEQGRVIADVMTAIADATFHFIEMKALADLRELPGFKNLPQDVVAEDGTWAAHKLSFRCMAYNTAKVKASDLPKTWDDLLTNPVWRNGHLALSNHPDSWFLVLWNSRGEAWGKNFATTLFNDVKIQRRKEGMTAVTSLTAAGEFDANIPAPEWIAQKLANKGAPIGYHCPVPVPVTVSQIAILDKSPRKNAARLFVNWMISREGQILQYVETFAVPVHKDLQTPTFLPFADTIVGKPKLVRDDDVLNSDANKTMVKTWSELWGTQGGAKQD
jgi:ABC-type Fe3+ transport system substrate-binding protein